MAIEHGFGASVTNGLTFAYDTIDTLNSYLGEPTTNLVIAPDGNANVITTDVPPGVNVAGYAQYSDGYFVNPRNTVNTAATGRTFTYSVWMRSRSATPSTYLMYVFTGTGPDGGWWYFGDGQLTQEWRKYSYTRSNMTGTISQVTVYRYNQQGTIDIAAPQIEEKPYSTQFVNGTRSSTQGLLDLTGNNVIDIRTASFNSSAQMIFDGSDDYISLTEFNPTFNDGITMECIAKWTNNPGGGWQRLFDFGNGPNADNLLFCRYSNSDQLFFGVYNGGANAYVVSNSGAIRFGQYALYTAVANGTTFNIYVNGQLIYSEGNTTVPINTPRVNSYIGKSNWADSYFNGEIPVAKIYSRALSDDEVLQNFKKYQTRFGIS
jgi:hypothetical protein